MFRALKMTLSLLAILLTACSGPADTPASPTEQPSTVTDGGGSPAAPTPRPTDAADMPVTGEPGAGGTPAATPPWAPQPGDAALNRGEVFLDGAEVILLESFPMQARLRLVGSRPTPCHALRVVVSPPDADNAIAVEVYTVVDPSQICTQVLEPFEETIPLGSFPTAEHPSGTYTVLVNGELAGEFAA